MSRVVVDLEKLRVLECGLGQFCWELSQALIEHRRPEERLVYFVPRGREQLYRDRPVAVKTVRRSMKRGVVRRLRAIAGVIPGPRYDLWHITNQASKFEPWNPQVPVLLTIHDLNFLREEKSPQSTERHLRGVQQRVDRASRVTTISHFVAQEIRQWIDLRGKQLDVVYNGAAFPNRGSAAKPAFAPSQPFLFSIGAFNEKKNFHTLVDMLPSLPGYILVLAGINDLPYGEFVRQRASQRGVADRVLLPGPVSDSDRQWLYQNCRAFVFPSLTEGFGLPPIEAMNAGKPVFLSNLTSLPEVGGDAAFYWNDFDPAGMAATIERGLAQADAEAGFAARVCKHAEQFNWSRAAQQYLTIYREMLDEQSFAAKAQSWRKAA